MDGPIPKYNLRGVINYEKYDLECSLIASLAIRIM